MELRPRTEDTTPRPTASRRVKRRGASAEGDAGGAKNTGSSERDGSGEGISGSRVWVDPLCATGGGTGGGGVCASVRLAVRLTVRSATEAGATRRRTRDGIGTHTLGTSAGRGFRSRPFAR